MPTIELLEYEYSLTCQVLIYGGYSFFNYNKKDKINFIELWFCLNISVFLHFFGRILRIFYQY